ncbi:hypothetical protein [Micromonospora aurantiaca (nom. illeg.)]|uniref:hypothetical protein n=1 Tax=Micromonospora aurantiaca (nom. illeg.) TaxID=47850 RepID=UPI0033E99483
MTRLHGVRGDVEPPEPEPADDSADGSLHMDFDVTVVGGEQGRRLAALQAEAVLDVLTWLYERHRASRAAE